MVKTMRAEVKKGTVPVADLALGSTFESSSLRHLTTCNIPHLARRVLFRTTMSHHVSFCYTGWETYAQESDRKEWVRNQYCQAVGCRWPSGPVVLIDGAILRGAMTRYADMDCSTVCFRTRHCMLSWNLRTYSGELIGPWIQLPCTQCTAQKCTPLAIDQKFPFQSLLLQVMITVGSIYWTLETEEVLTATDGNKVGMGYSSFETNDLHLRFAWRCS